MILNLNDEFQGKNNYFLEKEKIWGKHPKIHLDV
jgi:hypothetical protein